MSLKFNLTTGNLDSTNNGAGQFGSLTSNNLTLTAPFPVIYFYDTDGGADDYRIVNANGTLKIQESTGGVVTDRLNILNDGSIVFDLSALPTSDPASSGKLWRDGTDLKISAG